MVYNLVQYIDDNTSLTLNVNGFQPDSQNDVVSINEGSGDEQPWFDRKDTTIQVLSRATDRTTARKNSYTVYDLIKKKYGLSLPTVVVSGDTYSSLTAWGIRPVNTPQYAYDDDNGRAIYSFTVEITTT
jgi:hypothetical protein